MPSNKRPTLEDSAPPCSKRIKAECSPSPPRARRLVTFGVKRFAPLPSNCQSSCPEYKRNRKEWVAVCINELAALDLKIVRTMVRDDGLVIDWCSPVPVWSDTLKPEPCDLATTIVQSHRANARAHSRSDHPSPSAPNSRARSVSPWHGSIDHSPTKRTVPVSMSKPVSGPSRLGSMGDTDDTNSATQNGKKLPVPPRPFSIRRAIAEKSLSSSPSTSSQIHGPLSADDDNNEIIILDAPPSPKSPKRTLPVVTAPSTPIPEPSAPQNGHRASPVDDAPMPAPDTVAEFASVAEREMSEMTLDYLRRYVQTYEADRASLASAYSRLASFSYRTHRCHELPVHGATGSVPRASGGDTSVNSGLRRGRLDIITTLITLPSLHCAAALSETGDACPSTSGQLSYDILYLGAGLGMFVVCRAVAPTRLVVHSFMLQRREADKEEADVEGVWPVVANVHQVVVFEC